MREKVFDIVTSEIIDCRNNKLGVSTEGRIIMGNISESVAPDASIIENMIVMSLVSIEEDRISRPPENYVRVNQQMVSKNPPYYLNLYVLFSANYDVGSYKTALQYISHVIQFFQFKNVFTHTNTPRLPADMKEFIFDLKTLSLQDLNNMWGVLGSKYLPSVLFKVRLVTISEHFTAAEIPLIHEVKVNDVNWQPT